MTTRLMHRYCQLNKASAGLLHMTMEKLHLSARAYDHVLKVDRTVADLHNKRGIGLAHVAEAIQYRSLDESNWVPRRALVWPRISTLQVSS